MQPKTLDLHYLKQYKQNSSEGPLVPSNNVFETFAFLIMLSLFPTTDICMSMSAADECQLYFLVNLQHMCMKMTKQNIAICTYSH